VYTQLRCSFLRNRASGAGGAISVGAREDARTELIRIRNCTFVGNLALQRGGGE
jgi:predicted outer membrane repeat protein